MFELVGYQYDLLHGLVKPTQNRWESILQKVESILSNLTCRVRKFMSLIGLLTATEKQVPLGRLHMRPIQWHLKRHWRVPKSLEKEIPVPRTLHPHLQWWAKETDVLLGQPLHPLRHALQIFTDASLRRLHSKRHLVSSRKSAPHKFPGTKGCLAGTKKVPAHGTRESCSSCHR